MKKAFFYLMGFAMFIVGFYVFKQSAILGSFLIVLGGVILVVATSN